MAHILLRHRDIEDIHRYKVYEANGGYDGLKKVLRELEPQAVIDVVKKSNIRGRGGAGGRTRASRRLFREVRSRSELRRGCRSHTDLLRLYELPAIDRPPREL